MQQRSGPRFGGLFRPQALEEIPQSFAWFEEMRDQRPVFYDETMPVPMWQVFRYQDVVTVLTDYSRFSSQPLGVFMGSFLSDTMITKDPPDHRKLRNLVNQAFTPKAVARLEDRIRQVTQELLDQAKEQGKMDVVSDMAFPLPAKVIAEMLGVPSEDWDIFQRWARGPEAVKARQEGRRPMQDEMSDYFLALLRERRQAPREDLISALSVAEVDGARLSDYELVQFCKLLLGAGQETTKNLIANAIVCFTDHPHAMERLKREPSLMPKAIEEVLRYLPPVWFVFRQARSDVELGGQHIPEGQLVLPWTASANRDAAQFRDPDRFDIEREPNRHLAFGHGIHFCVGAPLARLEARIVLPMMLEQLPDLQRVEGFPIIVDAGVVFVIRSLPVTFKRQ